ncbi:ankyrin [Auriscalpium vulgare]|uniref:Ankyrin n=1 Tax=Auriscalpium vulgare TaxID=40419 RepID=A0ACB8R7S6_9AGAM|nr:ankyrin [Auriscalpium vulgare]
MTLTTHDASARVPTAPFIDAVMRGDDDYVRSALDAGEDVNATGNAGQSAVACAITGESWETADASNASFMTPGRLNVLRMLVEHKHISLYALNAPQDAMNGVTPLGVAAWMNAPEFVRILLEDSAGAVAVNGLDTHKATALMYAARDGGIEVADCLVSTVYTVVLGLELIDAQLSHGARPDYRDRNHRSSIHYALRHPSLLSLCESALREHRTNEMKSGNQRRLCAASEEEFDPAASAEHPPSPTASDSDAVSVTKKLVTALVAGDLPLLRSLLYTPLTQTPETPEKHASFPLVNSPDADSWSPIHYCASVRQPSIDVLDTLYLAGADVSLFSPAGNYTPLHCLARRKRGPDALRDRTANAALHAFVVHLVCDLRAPMEACDTERETCMHLAAEHGDSAEILRAMLECDTGRLVAEMRNSRGLTPLEVAKPEFRAVFGIHDEALRPASAASHLTIRPLHTSSSVPSLHASTRLLPRSPRSTPAPLPAVLNAADASSAFERVLRNLRTVTDGVPAFGEPPLNEEALYRLEELLRDVMTDSQSALRMLHARMDETRDGLATARTTWTHMDTLLDSTAQLVEEQVLKEAVARQKADEPVGRNRSGTMASADSQTTAVSDHESDLVADENAVGSFPDADELPAPWPVWLDPSSPTSPETHSTISPGDIPAPGRVYSGLKSYKSMSDLTNAYAHASLSLSLSPTRASHTARPQRRARADTLNSTTAAKRPQRSEPSSSKSSVKEGEKGSGARIKAWFRRKLLPERAAPIPRLPTPEPEKASRPEPEPRWSTNTLCEGIEALEKGGKEAQAEYVQRTARHYRALAAAGKDLARIDECMSHADKLIASAYRAISRTERILARTLQSRRAAIHEHRCVQKLDVALEAISTPTSPTSPLRSPPALKLMIPQNHSAAASSNVSPNSAVFQLPERREGCDDADLRALEYLVLYKMNSRAYAAADVVEKVDVWLDVVRAVLKGVQTRGGAAL